MHFMVSPFPWLHPGKNLLLSPSIPKRLWPPSLCTYYSLQILLCASAPSTRLRQSPWISLPCIPNSRLWGEIATPQMLTKLHEERERSEILSLAFLKFLICFVYKVIFVLIPTILSQDGRSKLNIFFWMSSVYSGPFNSQIQHLHSKSIFWEVHEF